MRVSGRAIVRPVLARVIGALATRAEFSASTGSRTPRARRNAVQPTAPMISPTGDSRSRSGTATGPWTAAGAAGRRGHGERILAQMEIPDGTGTLRTLADSIEVTTDTAPDGSTAEYVVFEVAG